MKIAIYKTKDGKNLEVEYDEKAPCIMCGLPVVGASIGGTNLCPWCDCGNYRDGTKFTVTELLDKKLLKKKAKEIFRKINNDRKIKMKTKHRFNRGDKVRLVGKDNPYAGESGEFIMYDKCKLEKERLLITVESDGEQHYFYNDEVKQISRFGGK